MSTKDDVVTYVIMEHESIKTKEHKFKQKDVGSSVLQLCKKKDVEKDNYSVVGFIKHKPNDNGKCNKFLDANGVLLHVSDNRSKLKSIAGYVYVDEGKYLAVEGRCFIPIIILPILILLLLFLYSCDNEEADKKIAETTDLPQPSTSESSGSIEFAGYSSVVVDSTKPVIYLYNPESNDVYFTYTVYDDDTNDVILEETDLIEPGKALEWEASDQLEKGVHNVHFVVNTYSMSDCSVTYTPAVINNIQITNN